jgi:cyanophycinase
MGDQLGALALVGSGEYTAAMSATDSWLIEGLGGPAHAHVALIPTASALEEGQPERWNAMGAAHFAALGARPAPLRLLHREDAVAHATAAALRAATFFYFSGGNPEYLAATLEDTPAWEAVAARHRGGAVVAGCSAGAMFLGSYLLRVRSIREGQGPLWRQGLGLAAGLAILPHFDRIGRFLDAERFREVLAAAPCGVTVVGIDEDTALVRLTSTPDGPRRWRVMGRQSISVFHEGGRVTVYQSGEELTLG